MSHQEVSPESCFCLKLQCAAEHSEWLSCQLVGWGCEAVEERALGQDVQLLLYDAAREPLERFVEELAALPSPLKERVGECRIDLLNPDWRLAWTQYLQPVHLTEHWTVVPKAPPKVRVPGELYLEPALAFGFGEHPSTTRIAPWIEAACQRQEAPTVLDVGCGTGVLSLLAACCGASHVVGVDTSEDAVVVAGLNAKNNHLQAKTEFMLGSANAVVARFDLVCANIESGILIALASDIALRLAPGGSLVLAGLLKEQEPEVIAAYRAQGIELAACEQAPGEEAVEWSLLASVTK